MNRLSTNELRQLIKKSGMTTEEYYKKLFALQEDIEFFNLYMKRNKKSEYGLVVKVKIGAGRAFDDIWKKYGYGTDKDSIERTFAETTLLSVIFKDMYDGTDIYSDDEIRSFKFSFEMYEMLFLCPLIIDPRLCDHKFGSIAFRTRAAGFSFSFHKDCLWDRQIGNLITVRTMCDLFLVGPIFSANKSYVISEEFSTVFAKERDRIYFNSWAFHCFVHKCEFIGSVTVFD